MNNAFTDFLDFRIEEIMSGLKDRNAEYAVASERRSALYNNIEPIINHGRDITISFSDCEDIRELLDVEITLDAVTEHELYKQGYRDCVKLLTLLGVLA